MAISGIGVIESGLEGLRPVLLPVKYAGSTSIYNLPYLTDQDIVSKGESAVSASEEGRKAIIVENHLIGVTRAHTPAALNGAIAFQGVYTDKSNHPLHNLIVSVSGIAALCNNIYIGDNKQEYVWSGLDHTSVNYLWLSLIEEPLTKGNYQSSRQFRDFEARSTTTLTPPANPDGSVLAATYLSGVGVNSNPYGITKFISVLDHLNQNQNPHGLTWFQNLLTCSGIQVLNPSIWNSSSGGLSSGLTFFDLKYLNNVTQYGKLIVSGIYGNIFSGNTSGTFFQNLVNLTVDPGEVGYLTVVSGSNISGSIFHNIMNMNSGVPIDTVDLDTLKHLVSTNLLSGSSITGIPLHKHFLGYSTVSNIIEPKYPGSVLVPIKSLGRRADKNWEYNNDLGTYLPTLRHKGNSTGLIYIRQYMPYGYNAIDSFEITSKIDGGAPASTVGIRNCVGTLLTPKLGNALTGSGLSTVTVSGFDQTGFSQLMPYDLEIILNTTSGVSQYLGSIKTNYKINA